MHTPIRAASAGVPPASADRFIRCVVRSLPGAQPALSYVLAQFQLAHYDPGLFAVHAIDCPPNILNSVPKRQAEYFAGRLCAQAVLRDHGHDNYHVATGAQREPVWPPGLIGSITHNEQYSAALVCRQSALLGVGIDIESIVDGEARLAMIEMIVSPQEAAYLRAQAASLSFDCLLTLVFSAKESFFKAAFAQVHQYFDFDAVRVEHIDVERRLIRLRSAYTLCERLREDNIYLARFDMLDHGAILTAVLLPDDASEAGVIDAGNALSTLTVDVIGTEAL